LKLRLALSITTLLAFATAASAAEAASLQVTPSQPCYAAGSELQMVGTGYTPSSTVHIDADGSTIGTGIGTGAGGAFGAQLKVGLGSGEKVKTYSATDDANPATTASVPLRITATDVTVSPKSGKPGRRFRIRARGFLTGSRLYAHVRKGRSYRKNVKVGRLTGACHKLRARKRLIRRGGGTGKYLIQFDTKRRYSRETAVRVRFQVLVFRTFNSSNGASVASVGERWVRVR
jgi:hypothetical protein